MFIDKARIYVKGGDGGNGCLSFRREKGIPRGGPNGGDGGKGGSIYVEANASYRTLIDQRYQQHYGAERGAHGKGKLMKGKDGQDLFIKVPCGTLVIDQASGEALADLTGEQERVLVAKGGRGGRGNAHFATASRQAPRIAEPGEEGQTRMILLELKVIADVGLVGLPNAGKSTLLAAMTPAHPKIGSYPFTTLTPNLGTLPACGSRQVVVADIPGLIEGAAAGAGLGNQFLRHVERTRLLLHVIDVCQEASHDPIGAYLILERELSSYDSRLIERPKAIAGNKIDLPCDAASLKRMEEFCRTKQIPLFFISALTREGVEALVSFLILSPEVQGAERPTHAECKTA